MYYAQQLIRSEPSGQQHHQTLAAQPVDANCVICFEDGANYTLHIAQQNDGLGTIPHQFHQACILNWAHEYKKKHPHSCDFSCPLCNQHVSYPPEKRQSSPHWQQRLYRYFFTDHFCLQYALK